MPKSLSWLWKVRRRLGQMNRHLGVALTYKAAGIVLSVELHAIGCELAKWSFNLSQSGPLHRRSTQEPENTVFSIDVFSGKPVCGI